MFQQKWKVKAKNNFSLLLCWVSLYLSILQVFPLLDDSKQM